MKKKILIPSLLVLALAASEASAQMAGSSGSTSGTASHNVSGAPAMAPGNPNTSTVVPDTGDVTNNPTVTSPNLTTGNITGANTNTGTTGNVTTGATGNVNTGTTSTGTFGSTMPSAGTAGNLNAGATAGTSGNLFATAPSDMSLSQFTTYMRGQWGVNGNDSITQSEWNNVNPAFFGNNKPAFSSLDVNHNGTLNNGELKTVYSRLYRQYKTQSTTVPAQ